MHLMGGGGLMGGVSSGPGGGMSSSIPMPSGYGMAPGYPAPYASQMPNEMGAASAGAWFFLGRWFSF